MDMLANKNYPASPMRSSVMNKKKRGRCEGSMNGHSNTAAPSSTATPAPAVASEPAPTSKPVMPTPATGGQPLRFDFSEHTAAILKSDPAAFECVDIFSSTSRYMPRAAASNAESNQSTFSGATAATAAGNSTTPATTGTPAASCSTAAPEEDVNVPTNGDDADTDDYSQKPDVQLQNKKFRAPAASDVTSAPHFVFEGKIDEFCTSTRELTPLWNGKVQIQVKRDGNGILRIPHPLSGKNALMNRPIRGMKYHAQFAPKLAFFYLARYGTEKTARRLKVNLENGLKLQEVLKELGAQS